MISRATTSWLTLGVIAVVGVVAADYGIFLYRQSHGDVLSFVQVRQYVPVNRGNGKYEYDFVGHVDVPCMEALLPHLRLPPCWWVSVNRFDWH